MATLALTMIIRDEPVDRLVMLIDYMRALCDRFVIMDTGSETFEQDAPLLRKAGAYVDQIEWRDDFAWARNQTLPHLDTDWAISLDADELPSYHMMKFIEKVLDEDDPTRLGVLFFTRNFWGGDWGVEVEAHWHIRMFRSARGAFYKPVHEQVQLDGRQEGTTRGTPAVLKAPKEAYLIHSKPREQIEKSALLYNDMAAKGIRA